MSKTFKDIGEGAIFKFAPSSDGFFHDHRIYVKITNRKYSETDKENAIEHTIGSVYAEIIVIKEA